MWSCFPHIWKADSMLFHTVIPGKNFPSQKCRGEGNLAKKHHFLPFFFAARKMSNGYRSDNIDASVSQLSNGKRRTIFFPSCKASDFFVRNDIFLCPLTNILFNLRQIHMIICICLKCKKVFVPKYKMDLSPIRTYLSPITKCIYLKLYLYFQAKQHQQDLPQGL